MGRLRPWRNPISGIQGRSHIINGMIKLRHNAVKLGYQHVRPNHGLSSSQIFGLGKGKMIDCYNVSATVPTDQSSPLILKGGFWILNSSSPTFKAFFAFLFNIASKGDSTALGTSTLARDSRKVAPDSGYHLNGATVNEPDLPQKCREDDYARLLSINCQYDPQCVSWCAPCAGCQD